MPNSDEFTQWSNIKLKKTEKYFYGLTYGYF